MSYIIKKNGKRLNNKKYETYEKARSYIRKKIRKTTEKDVWDDGWFYHANPSISKQGYSIQSLPQYRLSR